MARADAGRRRPDDRAGTRDDVLVPGPNDLVWNYVVANYLKGEDPPPFDLLYWNSDGTNLPGPLYCWYLRHMYLQNELRLPGALTCIGEKIDLRRIRRADLHLRRA